jgi:hypothetical protein
MTEESSAIAVREKAPSGAAVMKAVPIPQQLQDAGVRIIEEEGTGMRAIVLPPNVRQHVNLLTPISTFAAADPNWTPSVSLVKLDQEAHTYPIPGGGKLGLNKQALETLGRCAGVLYTRTTRVPTEELVPGEELWGYRALAGFRRADGTVEEVVRERTWVKEAEMMEIEDSVARKLKTEDRTTAAFKAEVRKRWIAELRHGRAKTESKAINRALRAGLGIPTSVTAAQLSKPWLVVGFNFTPDYDDPSVKQALVAIGFKASSDIYGTTPALAAGEATPADAAPEEIDEGQEPTADSVDDAAEGSAGDVDVPFGDPEQDAGGEAETSAAGDSSAPEPSLGEPALDIPDAVMENAGATEIKEGMSVSAIFERALGGDTKALDWLTWAKQGELVKTGKTDLAAAVKLYGETAYADLWAELPA